MREISRRVNMSVGAIKSLAKRHYIRLDERRQFITADMEKRVVQEAIDGQHRSDIAIKHEISVGAVEQIIQSVTGLSLWRQYLRMYDKRNEMRGELTDTLKRLPNASRKTIRSHANRSYIWLFKFDKKWLNKALPHKQPYQYHGYKLWVKRDNEFLPKLTSFLNEQVKNTSAAPTLKAVDIKLDNALIEDAKKALEQYPKTPSEQIERWCYIGMAAEKYLTGEEAIALQLGNGKVVLVPKE